jgi:TonB family protein
MSLFIGALPSWAFAYLLNSIWQVPLIFIGAWLAAHLARPAGPRLEHRVWVGALLAEIVLPACQFDLITLGRQAWAFIAWGSAGGSGHTRVLFGPGVVSGSGLLRLPVPVLAAIAIVYGCTLLYFAGRLGWGLWKTHIILRSAKHLKLPGDIQTKFDRHSRRLGSTAQKAEIQFAVSPAIYGPVTIGILDRVLLLRPGFLESVTESDLDAVLAHEFAHMERRDFAKNLLYEFLSLPVAYHPLLWLTRSRLAETREMVCDEMAAVTGRDNYARALLRLASMLADRSPAANLHAIGIFDANIFERRVMNLTQKRMELPNRHRIAIAAACVAVALATGASAVALRLEVSAAQDQSQPPKKIHVKAESMKLVTEVDPVYPEEAKKAGIQGSVILDAIVGKDGAPEHLAVQTGPKELQQSALDAVRQWRWEPFLLNGDPIEVETTVTVVYKLDK